MESVEPNGNSSFVCFKLNEISFAIDAADVVEALEITPLIKVPGAPQYLKGMTAYNGSYIPVVDLSMKLGLPRHGFSVNSCVLFLKCHLQEKEFNLGLLVDVLEDVLSSEKLSFPSSEEILVHGFKFDYLLKENDDKLLIVRYKNIFDQEELLLLSDLGGKI